MIFDLMLDDGFDQRRFRFDRMRVAAAVIGGAVISGVGSAVSGGVQAGAAKNAANAANQQEMAIYNQNRADAAPFRNAGYGAINTITNDLQNQTGFAKPFSMSDFYNDPGYQFQLAQGTQAVNNSAAAKGGLLSGAATKSIAQYSQGLANQTYGDAYNRYLNTSNLQYQQLYGVANLGQQSVAGTTQQGTQIAQSTGANTVAGITGAANAKAAGIVGASNAASSGVNSLAQYYALQNDGTRNMNRPTTGFINGGVVYS